MRCLWNPREEWISRRKTTDGKCSSWPSYIKTRGFPDSSAGKESACKAGDPDPIPGSGRSPGEGIGYPIQYSWASPVAQLGKNLPAMLETWVQSYLALIPGLGRSPGEGKGYPLQYSGLENSMDFRPGVYSPWGRKEPEFYFHYRKHLLFIATWSCKLSLHRISQPWCYSHFGLDNSLL